MEIEATAGQVDREPVANSRHSLVFLGIVALVVLAGYAAQHRQVASGELTESHADVIPIYLSVMFLNWLLVYFVWRGMRRRGRTFLSVIRGRWTKASEVLRDAGIALGFWGGLLAVGWALETLLGPGGEKSLDLLLPRTPGEVILWLANSVSAGFCEEFVFRGYVQRQLLAWTSQAWLSILGQGVIFGLMHAYQGWRPVLRICAIGILFGVLAAWRKSLRPGMIAHGWYDIWAGWLGSAIHLP